MTKVFNLNKQLASFILLVLVAAGCVKKDDYYNPDMSDPNRKTVVQLTGASDIVTFARDVNPSIDTFGLITITRSPNDQAGLNQALTVKLVADPSLVTNYNTANGTSYVALPAANYTLLDNISTVTFQPGQATTQIRIRLNKTGLDLSQQYALGFSIADPGSGAVVDPTLKTGVYAIGVKNQYDGHYQVTGSLVDAANATITGNYPMDVYLVTAGPNSVYLVDNAIGDVYHSILSGTSLSYYGAFGVQINFDPSGNGKVVSVVNVYGQPASNTRSAQLDPSGANQFNTTTKAMDIKYFMIQPSSVPTPPSIRTSFDEHFKYLGPR